MSIRKRRSDRSGRAPLSSPGRPLWRDAMNDAGSGWRLQEGMSSEDAAVEAGVSQPVGYRWFRKAGGMPPAMFRSWAKPLSGRSLSLLEREEIALLRVQGRSMQEIGRRLGRSASTISRELRRNAAPAAAGWSTVQRPPSGMPSDQPGARSRRSLPSTRPCALMSRRDWLASSSLRAVFRSRSCRRLEGPPAWPATGSAMSQSLEPEQIAQRLPIDFPDDKTMRISHEAIYQALFVQGKGALRRELTACLRTGWVLRVPRARVSRRGKSFVAPEIMISRRPAEAADRAVPGHWEGDLILGLGSSAIGTVVERTTRFTMLLHLPVWQATVMAAHEERAGAGWPWGRGCARCDHTHHRHLTRRAAPITDLGSGRRDGSACPSRD